MAIPDYQSLMLPLLGIAAEGETRVPAAAQVIADRLGLSEDEREEMLPSGKQRLLHNRVHWAKFYMTKAGLIDSPRRGVFVASAAGRDLLATKPARIDVETLKRYPAFVGFYNQAGDESVSAEQSHVAFAAASSDATPEEQIDAAYAVLTKALKADLLVRVLEQSPAFFERLIVDLLVAMGYGGSHDDAARQLGKSGDGGIDGIIDEDRLGLDRIYVQAKRYAVGSSVGRPEVQGFVGSLVGLGANKGVFVTTSTFSKQALDYAKGLQQRVILIDGARLTELMVEFGVGVRASRVIEVKRLDEDFFGDDG
ncbi:restriction endonuclease [Novosphingobium sp. Fuku2-ISO-50]|uniref:restriction endonuclease n=1 Tax=Novosphingobium sp. Fuku2-ISO-50 TaxID=1739114 RepID=UPI00076C535E|nr:restriction endonuclease [Novosphingobium sp. Fuku2-ISO-50]KUR81319.1 restriction endonuclease [Novosphingobium sp. Fuku2-ISO-50]